MASAMVDTDMARGPLMPMPTTAMEDMALAMEVMVPTDTARGPLMLMPTTAMEAMALAMEVMAVTDTARGLLILATVMVAMDTASNFTTKHKNSHRTKNLLFSIPDLNLFFLRKSHYNHELNKIC